jgi:hypothetical protein
MNLALPVKADFGQKDCGLPKNNYNVAIYKKILGNVPKLCNKGPQGVLVAQARPKG